MVYKRVKEIMRKNILENERRLDGRAPNTVRTIVGEVGLSRFSFEAKTKSKDKGQKARKKTKNTSNAPENDTQGRHGRIKLE